MTVNLAILPPVESSLEEILSLHQELTGLGRTTVDKAVRVGELLAGIKAGLKHGEWLPWIEENLPFSERTCRNYLKCFERRDQIKSAVIADLLLPDKCSTAHVSHNSGDNEWFTPPEIIQSATFVLGKINLDPASSKEANRVVRADKFFSKQDDGLSRKWHGNVWMNPPYQSDLIGQFTAKLAIEYNSHRVKQAIALVNNATETEWFSSLARHASAICFPKQRVHFWHPEKPSCSPLQGQALIYLGKKPARFFESFSSLGFLCHVHTL